MNKKPAITLAAKSAPDRGIFSAIEKSGIEAVEVYLSGKMLDDAGKIARLCGEFV